MSAHFDDFLVQWTVCNGLLLNMHSLKTALVHLSNCGTACHVGSFFHVIRTESQTAYMQKQAKSSSVLSESNLCRAF